MSQRTPRQELTREQIEERFRQNIALRYARLRQQHPELKDDASHEDMVRAVFLPKLELTLKRKKPWRSAAA